MPPEDEVKELSIDDMLRGTIHLPTPLLLGNDVSVSDLPYDYTNVKGTLWLEVLKRGATSEVLNEDLRVHAHAGWALVMACDHRLRWEHFSELTGSVLPFLTFLGGVFLKPLDGIAS